jgi:hypothetical protein
MNPRRWNHKVSVQGQRSVATRAPGWEASSEKRCGRGLRLTGMRLGVELTVFGRGALEESVRPAESRMAEERLRLTWMNTTGGPQLVTPERCASTWPALLDGCPGARENNDAGLHHSL